MSALRANFEKQLKQKIAQKNTSKSTDENFLQKQFKFFDMDNSGFLSRDEFIKGLNRIGIVFTNPEHEQEIFEAYDTDGDRAINYKEFIQIVMNAEQRADSVTSSKQQSPKSYKSFDVSLVKENLEKLKNKLKARGANGILGLGRLFKIIDDNGSGAIELDEFRKALKEYSVELNPVDCQVLFNYFDKNEDGHINYDEFLYSLRGNLNPFRKSIVLEAFQKLDTDRSGMLTYDDLTSVFNASQHPEVKAGKKTANEVYKEFLMTFENFMDLKNNRNGEVTQEEFLDYYSFLSASIDNDEYFKLMMTNAWKLEGAYVSNQKGTALEFKNDSYSGRPDSRPKLSAPQGSARSQGSKPVKLNLNRQMELLIQRVKNRILSRGPKGFIGLLRQFKNLDLDNDDNLNFSEFKKAVKDYRIEVTEYEAELLFGIFDRNKNGKISIDEFITFILGEMSEDRRNIVCQIFEKIDSNRRGFITISDIKAGFLPRNHPDVKNGKKSEEAILSDFMDTLDFYNTTMNGYGNDRLSRDDFCSYFLYISASVPDDKLFEATMVSTFKLTFDNSLSNAFAGMAGGTKKFDPNPKNEFLLDQHRAFYLGGTVSSNAPFGTTSDPTNYSTNLRPQTANSSNNSAVSKGRTAGAPSSLSQYEVKAQTGEQLYDSQRNNEILSNFRNRISKRGVTGILSLGRMFRIADDDNSKLLNLYEFSKVVKDFRIEISDNDIKRLFEIFDINRDGFINYDEFLRRIRGEMNEQRKKMVLLAFKKLDKNQNGLLTLEDIKGTYDASKHPDVISGKKSEDQIFGDFLDTFEINLSLLKNDEKLRDKSVNLEEFFEYYNNISASIDNDDYFELMIRNCWNLDNVAYQKAWRGDFMEKAKNPLKRPF